MVDQLFREVHLDTLDIALLVLRLYVGLVLVAHGSQKLFGWFGGHSVSDMAGMFHSQGLRPSGFWAWTNALAEFFGGLLFAFGVLTPLAAGILLANMLMAIALVHWQNGFFNAKGGFEFPLTLAVGALTIGLSGPGALALGPQTFAGLNSLQIFIGVSLIGILADVVGLAIRSPRHEPRQEAK